MSKSLKCKVCNSNEITNYCIENYHQIYLCTKCNLLFTNIKNALELWGHPHENLEDEYLRNFKRYSITNKFFLKLIIKLFGYTRDLLHLDVGCAHGDFIKYCNQKGIASVGIDTSKIAIKYAKKELNLNNVFNEDLEEHLQKKKSYNVVTSFNVLEHVNNPKLFVNQIFNATKKNGLCILRIPNSTFHKNVNYLTNLLSIKSLNKSVLAVIPPIHLSCFSKKNLMILFSDCGFKKIVVKPSPLSNASYVTLKNPYFQKFLNISIKKSISLLVWTVYYLSFSSIVLAPTIYVIAKK